MKINSTEQIKVEKQWKIKSFYRKQIYSVEEKLEGQTCYDKIKVETRTTRLASAILDRSMIN